MARPFRYTFILILVALGTCMAAVSGWRYARASAPVTGPIILVSIEALRADHLPAYGYRQVKTPAIDTLAADGIVFERAYAHVPQTLPSHTAMLTGRLPFENGVPDGVGFSVPTTSRLLSEMLRDRGYATGGIVSSFLLRRATGIDRGFTFFDDDTSGGDDPRKGLTRDGLQSEAVAEHWLDSVGTSRAFLFLHLDESRNGQTASATLESPYDTAITRADEAVGRLLRYLKTHQLYDQSTVILVSDHGEGLGDHGEQAHGLLVYDEALRVPLIVKPSAAEGAGRRVKSIAQHVDLVPTILDLAKAPIPGNLRGRSLTSLLGASRTEAARDTLVYSESQFARYHFGWSGLTSVTDGRYRYISGSREELYDLDSDPQELTNLVESSPKIVEALRTRMWDFVSGSGLPPLGPVSPVSEDDRERYEALGYVGISTTPAAPSNSLTDPTEKQPVVEQYRSAASLLAAREWKLAVEPLRTLAHQEPGMRDVWMLLASTATRADRPEIAVDAFKHAIQLAPDRMDAYLDASSALVGLRSFEDARKQAQHVVDHAEADASAQSSAHVLLARIALGRHETELARSEAALAEEADPTLPVRAYVDGRVAFDQRKFATALESFEPAMAQLEKTPGRSLADLRLYTAESLLRVERFPEAEALFLAEMENSVPTGRIRTGLTALYKATGRTTEAAAVAQH